MLSFMEEFSWRHAKFHGGMLSFMEEFYKFHGGIHLAVCTYYQYNGHAGWSVTYLPGNTLSGMSVQAHGFIPGLTSLVENIMPGNTQSGMST